MLSIAENELITRTGPSTPMGELFRRFWLPVALASEIGPVEAGPTKVRVLGEELVAFRNDDDSIGLLEAGCPHRLANLFWGRNEGDGLRCVYHGWKFAADGRCTEQPAEPRPFCDRVTARSYPAIERGGLLWAYLGPPEARPPFPCWEFTEVPADRVYVSKRLQLCNWLQNLEGELDSAHVQQLHAHAVESIVGQDTMAPPRYQIEPTDVGLLAIAARQAPEPGATYWRVTPFLMPSFTIIPMSPGEALTFTGAVPIDDTTMMGFTVTWHPNRLLTEEELRVCREDDRLHVRVDPGTFLPLVNKTNDYLIDRAAQAAGSMTGISGLRTQDLAVQEDQCGPISPRQREHLGATDRAIIRTRRLLLAAAGDLTEGIEPAHPHHAAGFRCRSVAATAPDAVPWQEVVQAAQPAGGLRVDAEPARAAATQSDER
jgi:phenylpropionate dioxygenase-like ring-hydroxylating dioxygenase large terminal subunit